MVRGDLTPGQKLHSFGADSGSVAFSVWLTEAPAQLYGKRNSMRERWSSFVLAILVGASFGNGQAWLLHAHDEHALHAHAIDLSRGASPMRGDSGSGDDHGHGESLPFGFSNEGIVVVLQSEPAIASFRPGTGLSGPGSLLSSVLPASATTASSIMTDARPQQRCAHATVLRAVDTILRSNHALLI